MKKSTWVALASLVIFVAAASFIIGNLGGKSADSNTQSSVARGQYLEIKACDVLTPSIAKDLAGSDATSSTDSSSGASSPSIAVSNCNYYSASNKKGVSLLARSALDEAGVASNESQFGNGLPSEAKKVSGYGDAAYWSPSNGQLNILKNNNWYILQVGGIRASDRNQSQAEAFANQIIGKL